MVSLCILKSYCKAHDKYTGIIKQVEIKKKKKKKKGCIDGSNPIISLNANQICVYKRQMFGMNKEKIG